MVKRSSRQLIEYYYPQLTHDFHSNKRIIVELATIPSKRLRNKIAGYTTHLMKRIQKGPVRGISFRLQEEEREKKDINVPEVSALKLKNIEIDPVTQEMLESIGFPKLEGVKEKALPKPSSAIEHPRTRGDRVIK